MSNQVMHSSSPGLCTAVSPGPAGHWAGAGQLKAIFSREYKCGKGTAALLIGCTALRSGFRLARTAIWLDKIGRSIFQPADYPATALAARLTGMGVAVSVLERHAHQIGNTGKTAVYLRCMIGFPVWGIGIADYEPAASLRAVLSAVSRSTRIHRREIPPCHARSTRPVAASGYIRSSGNSI